MRRRSAVGPGGACGDLPAEARTEGEVSSPGRLPSRRVLLPGSRSQAHAFVSSPDGSVPGPAPGGPVLSGQRRAARGRVSTDSHPALAGVELGDCEPPGGHSVDTELGLLGPARASARAHGPFKDLPRPPTSVLSRRALPGPDTPPRRGLRHRGPRPRPRLRGQGDPLVADLG